MTDVVESHASGRPPSRRGLAAGIAAIALLGGGLVATRAGGDARPAAAPSPAASETPVEAPAPRETLGGAPGRGNPWTSPTPSLPEPYALGEDDGPRLSVAPLWEGPHDPLLTVHDGYVTRLRAGRPPEELRLPGGSHARLFPVDGGTVVARYGGDSRSGWQGRVLFVPSGAATAHDLGQARYVAPALDTGTIWLSDDDEGGTVRQYDVARRRVRRTVTLPPHTELLSEVRGGLVLRTRNLADRGGVWDYTRGTWRTRFADFLVTAGRGYVVLAGDSGCLPRCFRVDRGPEPGLASTAVESLAGPPSVSPDGRWIVSYRSSRRRGGMELVAVDTTTGTETRVEGTWLTRRSVASYAWSRDSGRLYVVVLGDRDRGHVVGWRAGSPAAALVRTQPVHGAAAE